MRHYRLLILFVLTSIALSYGCNRASLPTTANLQTVGPPSSTYLPTIPPDKSSAEMALLIRAELMISQRNLSAATQDYLRLAELSSDPDTAKRATQVAIANGDLPTAISAAHRWVLNAPHSAKALASYALLALQANQFENALSAVDAALKIDPSWDQVIALRAQILLSKQAVPQALDYLKHTLQQQPHQASLRLMYAELLIKNDNLLEAQHQLNALLSVPTYQSKASLLLAQLALNSQQYQSATTYLKQVLIDPQQANTALFMLGSIAEIQQQNKAALQWYARITNGPFYLKAHIRIAAILASQNKLVQALKHLDSLNVFTVNDRKRVFLAQAALLTDADQFTAAANVLDQGLQLLPTDVDLLYARSVIAAKLEQWNDVERYLTQLLQQAPNQVDALNALGYTLADHTTHYQQALRYINKALALDPNNPAILDSMGWVQYRMGHYQPALTYLQHAYQRNQDSEIAAHLGEVLWMTRQHSAAKKIWQQGLQRSPNNPLLLKTIQRLSAAE